MAWRAVWRGVERVARRGVRRGVMIVRRRGGVLRVAHSLIARSLFRSDYREEAARRLTRRFCQLVLAACQAAAALLMDVLAGGMTLRDGGDGIACRFFSFLILGGRGDGVSSRSSSRSSSRGGVLFRGGVPLFVSPFVSCRRPVCVSWVNVLVLAFRLSCRRWRLASRPASRLVSVSRVVGRLVSALSCCTVFVSSFSRVISSCLVAAVVLCVFVSSCVSDGIGSLWRYGGAWSSWSLWCERCDARGDMRCGAVGRGVGRFGDVVSCGGACGAGRETRRMARRRAGR